MGKFFMGLLAGVILCALAGFLMYPNVKKQAYDSGVEEGAKKGMADGRAAGIKEGMAQLQAEQMQKHRQDSMNAVQRSLAAKRKAAAERMKAEDKPKPVQNWHVINGQIDDPIQ
jgi:flagellar biosynthesis/type III secretory pathway protein FliH